MMKGHSHSYAPFQVDLYGNALSGLMAGMPSTVDLIPPRANVNKTPLVISRYYNTLIPKADLHKTRFTAAGASYPVKTAIFTEGNSPMRFRAAPPAIMRNGNHGNQFYTSKLTAGGTVGAVLAAGAIVGGALITEKIKESGY
ncbi:hypothetical protein A4D02_13375 [Niastella koreensis]|uniref:Uncharacterized protein n=2 Tax=Niastella koreensis TaxID=354356 RepID=G8TNL6_NIAKG|nr:hypothetical protein [Niastella koreensis]AEW00942.1 hypothetical protein Niako_4686 [Niastella koreensis GR20-10]OQP42551.1 hypothetical protein A4D02_13375 [Niastella koreensis]